MDLQTPTSKERSIWKKARRHHRQLAQRVALLRMRREYALIVSDHAIAHGLNVKLSGSGYWEAFEEAIAMLGSLSFKLGVVMDSAESGELAARPTSDGSDLDVVGPDPLPAKWSAYQIAAGDLPPGDELGIAPLIVLGIIVVVVIGGILTVTAMSNTYSKKIDRDIEVATLEAEKEFCKDPNSAICKTWFKKKKTTPVKKVTGAIDYILGEGAGKKVAGGLVAVLVGGFAYWAFKNRKRAA